MSDTSENTHGSVAGQERVTVFTDGACLGNPGPGGWAALLVTERDGERFEKMLGGGEKETTNNRMEMLAVVEGLNALKRHCDVEVVTDSQYVRQGITTWIHNWKKKSWRTSAGKPVKNRELWEALDEASARHSIEWTWVKGHSGHPENERVDEHARSFAEKYR